MTTAQQHTGELTPADIDLQVSIIAVIVEKIGSLPQEEKDDLMSAVMDIPECETAEDREDVKQTICEILLPGMVGGLLERNELRAPSSDAKDSVDIRRTEIASRLKRLRDEVKLTQEQLAERSGLPQSHISRLEAGQHSPSLKTVTKLAEALNVSIGDLDPAQK